YYTPPTDTDTLSLHDALPILKRRLDRLPPYPVPSVGQPQGSRTIATIGHELFPVAVGNQPGSQGERLQQHAVGGPFVVEGEVLALMAYQGNAAGVAVPFGRAILRYRLPRYRPVPHGCANRVLEQRGADIGQHPLLVR